MVWGESGWEGVEGPVVHSGGCFPVFDLVFSMTGGTEGGLYKIQVSRKARCQRNHTEVKPLSCLHQVAL